VAEHAEEVYHTHKENGFVMIHIMMEGWQSESPADRTFLQEWADEHGLTFPVTAEVEPAEGEDTAVNNLRYGGTLMGGIPNFIVLDRELRIDFSNAGSDDEDVLNRVAELVAQ
jgi:hypothetical protein